MSLLACMFLNLSMHGKCMIAVNYIKTIEIIDNLVVLACILIFGAVYHSIQQMKYEKTCLYTED